MGAEDLDGPEISVTVHLLGGSAVQLRLFPGETVLDARAQAKELLGRRPRLVFSDRVLADSESIAAAGLRDGSELTAVLSDGPTSVLTSSTDGCLRLFDIETGTCMGHFAEFSCPVSRVVLSPDSAGVLAFCMDGTTRLLDAETTECQMTFEGYSSSGHPLERTEESFWRLMYSGGFSPDSSRVVVPCTAFGRGRMHSGVAKIFNVSTGFHLVTLADFGRRVSDPGMVYSAVFSPDGAEVLLAADNNAAHMFDAERGALQRVFLGHVGDVRRAVISADGKRVLTASDDGTALLFDVRREARVATFFGGSRHGAVSVEFSPSGEEALVAGKDFVKVFDLASHGSKVAFEGHQLLVHSACFSPGGSKVLTACADGSARLFVSSTGDCEVEFTGHSGSVTSATFTLDAAEGTQW